METGKKILPTVGDRLVSAQQAVYEHLREQILTGQLPMGQMLRQEDLARRLGVSRLPVREALQRLSADGFTVLRPRRGYRVTVLDPAEIEDIFDMRSLLEERAGHLAALGRSDEDLREVAAIVAQIDALGLGKRDYRAWARLNRQFHARLYQSSGRRQLCRTTAALRDAVEPYIRIVAMAAGELTRAQREHHQILDAFRKRNGEKAGRLCREHCDYTARRLLQFLKTRAKDAA